MFITGRTRKLQSPYMFSGVLTSYFTDLTGGGGGVRSNSTQAHRVTLSLKISG